MHWKRLTHTLLLGMALPVLGVGCAAVDALVSSPAGRSANGSSPERLAAIGQMFEAQGRLAHAKQMYRGALRSDPKNLVASQRLADIAERKKPRTFDSYRTEDNDAVAVASYRPQQRPVNNACRTASRPAYQARSVKPAAQQATEIATALVQPQNTVVEPTQTQTVVAVPVQADSVEFVTADTDVGAVAIVDTGWDLSDDDATPAEEAYSDWNALAEESEISHIETVAFENSEAGTATVASMETEWQSSQSLVSLDELTVWMEFPFENRDNLIHALEFGEEDGVRALAAVALIECPLGDKEINQSLRSVSFHGTDLVRVTALDSLIQRGSLTPGDIESLLGLLRSEDSEIQSQSAASLRNLAGTEWSVQCVNGLGRLLNDHEPAVASVAAITLGDFGTEASTHRTALRDIADHHSNPHVADSAVLALRRIPGEAADDTDSVELLPTPAVDAAPQPGEFLPSIN